MIKKLTLGCSAVANKLHVSLFLIGNLHFSYLMAGDAQDGKLYKCRVMNNYLDVAVGGSYSKLQIIRSTLHSLTEYTCNASTTAKITSDESRINIDDLLMIKMKSNVKRQMARTVLPYQRVQ